MIIEENIGKTLSDIHHSRIVYDPPPRILEIKAKIWHFVSQQALEHLLGWEREGSTDCTLET